MGFNRSSALSVAAGSDRVGASVAAPESLARRSSCRACCAADIGVFTSKTAGSCGRSSASVGDASRDSGSVSFRLASVRPVGAEAFDAAGIPLSAGMLPGAKVAATDARACAKSASIDAGRDDDPASDARGSTKRDEVGSG